MKRDILLVEPAYKNKYPPLGLMKISAYHKLQGDRVVFVKGKSKDYQLGKWDRIYVTTLFSFYWKITIDTILFYKRSVNKTSDFYIGGIMASLMADEVFKETGLKPFIGLLDKPGILDKNNPIIIDNLTPDYDILEEVDYVYPANNSYLGYMTRGCVKKCPFCAVPKLEPTFKDYISLNEKIISVDKKYGKKKNLLLMDNNVLASQEFPRIINEIKEAGFEKGAKYQNPDLFSILMERIKNDGNNELIIKKISLLFDTPLKYIKSKEIKQKFIDTMKEYELDGEITREKLLKAEEKLKPFFEKYRNKAYGKRYVDFNQGIDPRLLSEKKIRLLSELSINPLRIAFDSTKKSYIEKYKKAVSWAAKYGMKNLSNYILYNWETDTPEDFYERLKINIELNESLGVRIFSFPMKYIPVNAKDRSFVGKYWNIKYLRAIQKILLVTGGAVMPGKTFFEKAFGKNIDDFHKIMLMPDDYIIERFKHEKNGNTKMWWDTLKTLDKEEYSNALKLIKMREFDLSSNKVKNGQLIRLFEHYATA